MFAYDQLGRRITRTLPLGMSESYGYDAVGNLTSKKDLNGHTTTYAYDNMNRLQSKTADAFFSTGSCAGGACGATQVSYTYSATGRRLSMTDASGTTSYTYDTRDRLLTKAAPAGTLTYTYDAAGNTQSLASSNAGGASMIYGYDQLNRLASVTDASGVTSYAYDAVGNLSGYTYPNGVATSYTFDTLNRLASMKSTCSAAAPGCGGANTAIASYAYTLGAAGNRLTVAELSGRTVQYGYDDLYRLTSETVASDPRGTNGQVSYTFDSVGNRLQRNSTLPGVVATGLLNYDANDRTSTDSYDANGNLLSSGAGVNVYDFENRLVQAGGVKLVYDGDGNRVCETVAGTTTNYLVADQNLTGYAQVLDELHNGAVSRTYSYGLELINERQTVSGSPTTSFYGFDGHGSVRFLTSSTGAVTDTYDYDAFGNLIAQTGTTPNNYLFAGEQFDSALGIYYNRARYYDERMGRFWTMDAHEGVDLDPPSLHRYLYGNGNPVDQTDPSGRDSIASLAIGAAIVATIVTIAVLVLRPGKGPGPIQNLKGIAGVEAAKQLVAAAIDKGPQDKKAIGTFFGNVGSETLKFKYELLQIDLGRPVAFHNVSSSDCNCIANAELGQGAGTLQIGLSERYYNLVGLPSVDTLKNPDASPSAGGAIIHELTHATLRTLDHAYYANVPPFVKAHPDLGLDNADSYRLFAEHEYVKQ